MTLLLTHGPPIPVRIFRIFNSLIFIGSFKKSLFGASVVVKESDQDNILIVGGSTSQDIVGSSSSSILSMPAGNPDQVNEIKQMRTGRTFPFPILTNNQKNLFIIGGTQDQKIDVYDLEKDMSEMNLKEVQELEQYIFFELSNYTTDVSFSSCSFA